MVPVLKLFLKMDLLPGRNSYDIIDYPLVGVNDRRDSYSDSIDFRGYQLINHAVDVIQHLLFTPSGAAGFRDYSLHLSSRKDCRHADICSAKVYRDSHKNN